MIVSLWLILCQLKTAAEAVVEVGPNFTSSDLAGEFSYFVKPLTDNFQNALRER